MKRRIFLAAGAAAVAGGPARADNGVTDTEILLGQTGILSGPLGTTIKSMLGGAQLAFNDTNSRGGVAGRAVKLVSMDDELKPDKAVANYRSLLNDQRVLAFFGCVGSGTTAASAGVLAQSGAPMVGGYAVADSAREKVKGSAYFVRASTGREAEALVQHLTTLGVTRIAVAHLDNPGGAEARALVESALSAKQLKLQAAVAVKGDGSNAAEAGKQLAGNEAQAVIMYLSGVLPGEVMKATWALGARPMFYGMSIVAGELAAKTLGEHARGLAIAQVVPYPWAEVDPVVREYRRLADAAGVPLSYYSYEGYLSGIVMLESLRRCGRELTRARLHAALRGLKMRLAGMDVDFTTGHATGSNFVDLVQVSVGGRFVR
jgi:branched-chain amino acid transport system substrate-binding protein